MDTNKSNKWKRIRTAAMAALLTAVFVTLEICSIPVMAQTNGGLQENSLMEREDTSDRKGMEPLDLSQEGIDKARVDREELVKKFNIDKADREAAWEEFESECVVTEETADESRVSGNSLSGNSISMDGDSLLAERAVYATASDAAEYLCDKLVQRKDYITVKVTSVSNTSKLAVNEYARQILNEAVAYNENGDPDEGDYLYWHMSYLEWAGWTTDSGVHVIEFGVTYRTEASEEKFVTQKVNSIIKNLNLKSSSLNDYQKVRLIYDYIMQQVEYDYFHYEFDQSYGPMYTAYGALADGTAVCQAYATLFYRLCQEVGIPARVIAGNNDENGKPTHGWNIVKIGNCYYNVDATWDDGDVPSHVYFLKTKDEFYSHTRDASYETSAFNKAFPMATSSYILPETEGSMLTMNAANITGTLSLTDGSTYSLSSAGKPKVILFLYRNEDKASTMVDYFYQVKKLTDGSSEGVIVDIYNNYSDPSQSLQLMEILKSMTTNPSLYKYSPSYVEGLKYRNQYAALAGKAQGNTSAIVIIDGTNKVRYFGEGLNGVSGIEKALSDLSNSSQLGTVSSLKASQTKNNEAIISWAAFGGANKYLVYRKLENGAYYCLGSTTKTTFKDEVSAKKNYAYKVYAYNGKNQVAKSGEIPLKTKQILPKKGKTFTVDGNKYKVLTSTSKSQTVSFIGVSNKNTTYVEIPTTVKIHGISYKVTEVASGALKNKKKLKTVVVGGNVTQIGSKAFAGSSKLINIVIESKKLKKVGSSAFKNIASKAQIRVPSSKYKTYKNLLDSKGQKKTVKIKK